MVKVGEFTETLIEENGQLSSLVEMAFASDDEALIEECEVLWRSTPE